MLGPNDHDLLQWGAFAAAIWAIWRLWDRVKNEVVEKTQIRNDINSLMEMRNDLKDIKKAVYALKDENQEEHYKMAVRLTKLEATGCDPVKKS